MQTVYNLTTAATIENSEAERVARDGEAVWVDLFRPDPEEIRQWNEILGIDLPTRPEMEEIESTSRLYIEESVVFMTATILSNAESDQIEATPVTFSLGERFLVTIRYVDNLPFRSFIQNRRRNLQPNFSPGRVLSSLLDHIVDRLADILESTGAECDRISREIFRAPTPATPGRQRQEIELKELLRRTGMSGEVVSKVRESLVTLQRVILYFIESLKQHSHEAIIAHVKGISRDVNSLSDHANFLNGKIAFLLDAILGQINIQQNQIIKIFSIAAVIFLPPTVVGTVYGMNFKDMPELDWRFGYPMALVLMVLSAVLTYALFRKKGWI